MQTWVQILPLPLTNSDKPTSASQLLHLVGGGGGEYHGQLVRLDKTRHIKHVVLLTSLLSSNSPQPCTKYHVLLSVNLWGKGTIGSLPKATQSLPPSLFLPPPDLGPQYSVGTATEGRGTACPWEQSATPALTSHSLWPHVGGLQPAVIIVPALFSSSTLLIFSCMLWKTCFQWSWVAHPSPPSPSGAQVSH